MITLANRTHTQDGVTSSVLNLSLPLWKKEKLLEMGRIRESSLFEETHSSRQEIHAKLAKFRGSRDE